MVLRRTHRLLGWLLLVSCACAGPGCSRAPSRLSPPRIDASAAGHAAMELYDSDDDGRVAGDELDQAPSLKAAIKNLDKDSSGGVTAAEVTDRIRAWQATRIGVTSIPIRLTFDGEPLGGATVILEPEAFLGTNVKPAAGVSDEHGAVSVTIAEEDRQDPAVTGVHCGLYLVRITKDGLRIPAIYNTETTLGCEVANDAAGMEEGVLFELKSK